VQRQQSAQRCAAVRAACREVRQFLRTPGAGGILMSELFHGGFGYSQAVRLAGVSLPCVQLIKGHGGVGGGVSQCLVVVPIGCPGTEGPCKQQRPSTSEVELQKWKEAAWSQNATQAAMAGGRNGSRW